MTTLGITGHIVKQKTSVNLKSVSKPTVCSKINL